MNSRLVFLSVIGMAAATAHAQSSVTLYGVVDSGLLYKSHSGTGGSALSLGTGVESTDRWGLQGAEDLGNGLQATFNLESGFRINTGAFINGGQAASAGTFIFDRGATVGIRSREFGWVTLGENRSPLLKVFADIDVSGYSNFGSLNNTLYQSLSGYTGYQYSWVPNSVEYETPDLHGFKGSVMYSLGGNAGDLQTKQAFSVSGIYRIGTFVGGASYFDAKDPTGLTDKNVAQAYTVGGSYRFDKVTVGLDFSNFQNPSTGTSDNFYTGEVSYSLTPAWVLSGTYIHLGDRVDTRRSANLYKMALDYYLSKKTNLYVNVGYVRNGPLGTLGLQNSTPSGVTGGSQLGAAIGVRELF
jgi:predicted porin